MNRDQTWQATVAQQIRQHMHRFMEAADRGNKVEQDVRDCFSANQSLDRWLFIHTKSAKAAKDFQHQVDWLQRLERKRAEQRQRQFFQGQVGQKHFANSIKQEAAAPLQVLQRPKDQPGRPKGTFTADQVEVNQIMREAWGPIYAGSQHDLEAVVTIFCSSTPTTSTRHHLTPLMTSTDRM